MRRPGPARADSTSPGCSVSRPAGVSGRPVAPPVETAAGEGDVEGALLGAEAEAANRKLDRSRSGTIAEGASDGLKGRPVHRPGGCHAKAQITDAPGVLYGRAGTSGEDAQPRQISDPRRLALRR